MSVKIIVDNQDLELALIELKEKQYALQSTRWYKKRYGYFEKPSTLNRKKKKMKLVVSQRQNSNTRYIPIDPLPEFSCYMMREPPTPLILKINLKQQFSRTGKNAMGY